MCLSNGKWIMQPKKKLTDKQMLTQYSYSWLAEMVDERAIFFCSHSLARFLPSSCRLHNYPSANSTRAIVVQQ